MEDQVGSGWIDGTRARMRMKLLGISFIVLLLVALVMPLGCGSRSVSTPLAEAPEVRVRLSAGVAQVSVTMDQPPEIVTDGGQTRRKVGIMPGQTVSISLTDAGWKINASPAGAGVLEIIPANDGSILINGLPYRGKFRFVPVGGGKFDVVNDVNVEAYLQGVLAKELLPDWHVEAYRAQAVIARTYALYEVKTNPQGRHWDLHPDERSQVYGGMKAESVKATSAVESTRGAVVVWGPTDQEKIFKAYFSSCCGGVSSSSGDAFNESVIPPLDAKYNGNTCSISTRYNWGPIAFKKDELTRRFRAWGVKSGHALANVPGIANIEIASTNQFGRPRRYMITDTKSQQYSLTSEQTRWAINSDANGGPTIYSGFFKPVDSGDSIQLVEGHGFGHGVGACQWCMQSRALAGEGFETIATKAYPQSKVLLAY